MIYKSVFKKSISAVMALTFTLSITSQARSFNDTDFSYISQNHLRPTATIITKEFDQNNISIELKSANPKSSHNSIQGKPQEFSNQSSPASSKDKSLATPVVLLVGKPGSGKTHIGKMLSSKLGPTVLHLSMGEFIRNNMKLKTPLSREDRQKTYRSLAEYIKAMPFTSLIIFDNNPYGNDSYDDLTEFLARPELELNEVIEIDVANKTALDRMNSRGRQDSKTFSYQDRLDYYDNNIPAQLEKFSSHDLLRKVDNNQTDGGDKCFDLIYPKLNAITIEACRVLVSRLSNRLQKRLNLKSEELADAEQIFVDEILEKGLFEAAMQVKGRDLFKYPSCPLIDFLRQEAKLFLYAEPSIGNQREFIQAAPIWDEDAAKAMEKSREEFRSAKLSKATKDYWDVLLPRAKGDVENFNSQESDIKVSIVMLVLASRIAVLGERLEELRDTMEGISFEVNIVLADPANLPPETKANITETVKKFEFPIKLIPSKDNTIAKNRNLGSSESRGEFIVFLDDDVRLSKRTIPSMIEALEKHPEIGVAQAVTYDGHTGILDRPKTWFSKYSFSPESPEVMITNIAVGMVVATRSEIVRALPFVPFWPNFGEDVFFGTQVKNLGFYLSFIYDADAFVMHEHVTASSATRSKVAFKNSWIHHTLSYYLNPDYYHDLGQIEMTVRINKTFSENPEEMENFFLLLRSKITEFLEGTIGVESFKDISWSLPNKSVPYDILSEIVDFYVANKEEIVNFKREWINKNNGYLLPVDNVITVDFPEKELEYGIANGFSVKINSSQEARGVIYQILNAMRNNAGPKAIIQARGTAKAYLARAAEHADIMHYTEKTKEALERYYGLNAFDISISDELASLGETKSKDMVYVSSQTDSMLSGVYLGIDIGGKSAKLAALVEGEEVLLGVEKGDSYSRETAQQHVDFVKLCINAALNRLADKRGKTQEEMKVLIKGIGISWNAPVKVERLITHYDNLNTDEAQKMQNIITVLREHAKAEINPTLRMIIENDGFAGAMSGAFLFRAQENKQKNIAYLGLGTGLALGFLTSLEKGAVGFREIHKMKAGYAEDNPYDIGPELSIKGFQGLTEKDSEDISEQARKIIESVNRGNMDHLDVPKTIGKKLADFIKELLKYWPIERVVLGGGICSGRFGKELFDQAAESLGANGPEIYLLNNQSIGHESAIGIAYSSAVQSQSAKDKYIIADFLTTSIPIGRDYYSEKVNVHEEFKIEEGAIIREQKRLEGLVDNLLTGTHPKNPEQLKDLRTLFEELNPIIQARRKFIELGVPAYHSHTNIDDDGIISPADLIDKALANNITVLYVTGHNRMGGSLKAVENIKGRDNILEMYPGIEIDAPVLEAAGIVHFVVIGPDDLEVINKMQRIGEETFTLMQENYQWRLQKMLGLSVDEKFEDAWREVYSKHEDADTKLKELIQILARKSILTNLSDIKGLKSHLKQWFKDVAEYVKQKGSRNEIYNKLDVLGSWTDKLEEWSAEQSPIWPPGEAGTRRKAMRGFFELLHSDADVEKVSGAAMRRASDLLEEFKNLGCRITLAHPEYELFVINEIPLNRHEEFWKIMGDFVKEGKLHAIGAGWSRGKREEIARRVDLLREQTNKSEQELRLVLNIPDYHGEEKQFKDIRKGMYQKLGGTDGYYVWEDIKAHDVDSYFADAEFLGMPYIEQVQQALSDNNVQETIENIIKAYRINPYTIDKLIALLPDKSSSSGVALYELDLRNITLAAEAANLSTAKGIVAYNDTQLSQAQQEALQSIIGIGTQGLSELESKLGCKVRLLSQGDVQDSQNTIVISSQQLADYSNSRHFIIDQTHIDLQDKAVYISVFSHIPIAKGLLGLTNKTEQPRLYSALKESIRSLSQGLLNEKEIEDAIEAYINGNPMLIKLPPAVSYKGRFEEVQRVALMALIAA